MTWRSKGAVAMIWLWIGMIRNGAAPCGHGEALGLALDPGDRRPGQDRHTGLLGARQQALMEPPGMEPADVRAQQPAMVEVAADLPVLLGPRHDLNFDVPVTAQQLRFPGQDLVVLGNAGTGEAPAQGEVASDLLALEKVHEVLARDLALPVHRHGTVSAQATHQRVMG
jgi:hypothetical protein